MAVNATAVWRVRPGGSNTNGGGYDPGISGAATDYSKQNSAQASGTHGTTVGTTSFVDATANAFTSAMVGNAIYITGSGQTTGWYFVTAFSSASTVTLDRSPGTGTLATWNLGGGWADPFTNLDTTTNVLVPGNIVYVLGSGTPNPSAYTPDYTYGGGGAFPLVNGNTTAGSVDILNDPATPGYKAPPDTTGGMPVVKIPNPFVTGAYSNFAGLYFVGTTGGASSGAVISSPTSSTVVFGCVFDQLSQDISFTNGFCAVLGCEVFTSTAPGAGAWQGLRLNAIGAIAASCNIHDTNGPGVLVASGAQIINSIISKCQGIGVNMVDTSTNVMRCFDCTIDGNTGNGIEISSQNALASSFVANNIISNHTTGGKFGLTVDAGTAAQNNLVQLFVDYNVYYNNAADLNAISYGPHDTHGGANPYVGQATENYTLA